MKTFGELFKESGKEYKSNFKVFLIIFLLLFVILSLISFLITIPYSYKISTLEKIGPQDILNSSFVFYLYFLAIIGVISLLLYLWMSASFIYNSVYRKKEMSVRETLLGGKKYFLKYLGYSIVFIIFIGSLFFLLIIPGIIFLVFWSFSPYILIKENKGIIESLSRSFNLIKGRWWRTFGILLLFVLVLIGIYLLISFAAGFINLIISLPYLNKGWNSLTNIELPFSLFIITEFVYSLSQWIYNLISLPLGILFLKNLYLDYKSSKKKGF